MANLVLHLCILFINTGLLSFGVWLYNFISDKSTTTTQKLNSELGQAGLWGIVSCCITIFLYGIVLFLLARSGKIEIMGKEGYAIIASIPLILILALIIFAIIYDTKLRTGSEQEKTDRLINLAFVIVSICSGILGLQSGLFLGALTSAPVSTPKEPKPETK